MGLLDRLIGHAVAAARWLVLPVAALLFLQWPLRDWVRAYSREANDFGQVCFAVFVAVAVTAATRAQAHLATGALAARYRQTTRRRLERTGAALVLIPWSVYILWAGWPIGAASLRAGESFPDTGNPGYFVVKLAMLLLALLVVAQALVTLAKSWTDG